LLPLVGRRLAHRPAIGGRLAPGKALVSLSRSDPGSSGGESRLAAR
jgi:hypothetical protein